MKTKYLIRETTSLFTSPPYVDLFFGGFTHKGVSLVIGPDDAKEYDTLEAVKNILKQVKERSGRDSFTYQVKEI